MLIYTFTSVLMVYKIKNTQNALINTNPYDTLYIELGEDKYIHIYCIRVQLSRISVRNCDNVDPPQGSALS